MDLKKKISQFKTVFPFISHNNRWQIDHGTQVPEMLSYRNSHDRSCANKGQHQHTYVCGGHLKGGFGFRLTSVQVLRPCSLLSHCIRQTASLMGFHTK